MATPKKVVKSKAEIKPPLLKKSIKPPGACWDLYKHGLSYSLLAKFIVCRERFRLRTVEGLTPDGKKDAIEFGSIFHKALELYAKGYTQSKILAHFRTLSRTKNKRSRESFDPLLCRIATTMLPMYTSHWKHELAQIKYFETEKDFEILHNTGLGHLIPLRGKRDEGFIKNGKLWLQENKTKSQINEELIIQTLSQMLQPMLYLYSFQHDYPGKEIGGILYNIVRKPNLQQGKDSENNYIQRIVNDIESRPDHYFKMFSAEISHQDIQNWVAKYLNPLLCQVALWWESIKHNPFDPWTTPKRNLGIAKDPEDAKVLVQNPHHFLAPFGVYNPMSTGLGEYFGKVTYGVDSGLRYDPDVFPELDIEFPSPKPKRVKNGKETKR